MKYFFMKVVAKLPRWRRRTQWKTSLGFFMYDRSKANPANFQADDWSHHEASIAPDPEPVEAPVDKDDGEPLVEDRFVPLVVDEETVVVFGVPCY